MSERAGGGVAGEAGGEAAQPRYTAEYLAQLLSDKKQLGAFPNVFAHLHRLLDDELSRVRVALFQFEFKAAGPAAELPEKDGSPVQTLTEKVYVPVQNHPDYNFVGRILGPRGMTAKQLEQETGCKVMVRGRGSTRDKKKEEANRGKANWEHLSDSLHVLLQCEDTAARCKVKLARAVKEIQKLLVPAVRTPLSRPSVQLGRLVKLQPEGEDELKRKQLTELAIINGTYRSGGVGGGVVGGGGARGVRSPLRSPSLAGAPLMLSPGRSAAGAASAGQTAALYQQAALLSGLGGAGGAELSQALLLGALTPDHLALLAQHHRLSALPQQLPTPLPQALPHHRPQGLSQGLPQGLPQALYAQPQYATQLSSALGSPLLSAQGAAELAVQQQMDSLAGAMVGQRRAAGREQPYKRPLNRHTPAS